MEIYNYGTQDNALVIEMKRGESINLKKGSLIFIKGKHAIKPSKENSFFLLECLGHCSVGVSMGIGKKEIINVIEPLYINMNNVIGFYNAKYVKLGKKIIDYNTSMDLIYTREGNYILSYKGDKLELRIGNEKVLVDLDNLVLTNGKIKFIPHKNAVITGEEPLLAEIEGPAIIYLQTITL